MSNPESFSFFSLIVVVHFTRCDFQPVVFLTKRSVRTLCFCAYDQCSPAGAFFGKNIRELSSSAALQSGIGNIHVNKAGDLGHVTKSILDDHHVVSSTWLKILHKTFTESVPRIVKLHVSWSTCSISVETKQQNFNACFCNTTASLGKKNCLSRIHLRVQYAFTNHIYS